MERSCSRNWSSRHRPMSDNLTAKQRSACMRAVRGEDTVPEMRVRQAAHSLGYRYALHRKNLPGKPDLVFVCRRKIVFVHRCFLHLHKCRHGTVSPASNMNYWCIKREKNRDRDKNHLRSLRAAAWKVLVVWECQTQDTERLRKRLAHFLG